MRRGAAIVKHTGEVDFSFHGEVTLNINMALSYYPYDVQNVTMIITSWSHTADEVFLYPYGANPISIAEHHFSEDIAWELGAFEVDNETLIWEDGIFTEVDFSFLIKRHGSTITVTVIVPGIAISFMSLLFVCLPKGNGERMSFLTTILLTVVMFLVMLTNFVPLSRDLPHLEALFLCLTVLLTFISVPVVIIECKTK